MTPKQLREWLFQNSQEDQWWVSLDAVTEECAVTVNEIEERLKSGQYGQTQVSQTELSNPPWIDVELPAAPPQRMVTPASKNELPPASPPISSPPTASLQEQRPALIVSLLSNGALLAAVLFIVFGFFFPPAWALAIIFIAFGIAKIVRPPKPRNQSQQSSVSGSGVFGLLLLVVGLGVVGYCLLFFDTSVSTGYGSVNNLGLMNDKQNGIIVGGILAVVGVLLGFMGKKQ
jgi:hypothetical protein